MKKIYTLIFSQNNLNHEENYLIDLDEIKKSETLVGKVFEKALLAPRQEIIDQILKFAKESK